jgi:hypothetical protein
MKNKMILVGTILAMGLADSIAQGPPGGNQGNQETQGGRRSRGGNQLMAVLDKNGDGTLDSSEIQQASRSLRELDANKDFKLTPDELGIRTRGAGGNMSARLMEMDANKDGKLSSDEVPERMQRFVDRMDSNGDGAVDENEMEAFQNAMRQRWEEGGGPGRGNRGGPPED